MIYYRKTLFGCGPKLTAVHDDARDKAEDAVSAAEDVEDSATMRYLNTGRFEDQMRMHDAEDAADKAREARDSLDN